MSARVDMNHTTPCSEPPCAALLTKLTSKPVNNKAETCPLRIAFSASFCYSFIVKMPSNSEQLLPLQHPL